METIGIITKALAKQKKEDNNVEKVKKLLDHIGAYFHQPKAHIYNLRITKGDLII
jgi:hypothetical protein